MENDELLASLAKKDEENKKDGEAAPEASQESPVVEANSVAFSESDVKEEIYLHGRQVKVTKSEKEEVLNLTNNVHKALGDRLISEVPLKDEFYEAKSKLDSYVASLE